jgi:TonB family protein
MTPLKAVPIDISAVSGLPKFEVVVQIVIGKDGKVVDAKALSGPKAAYKAAESAARKWTYLPYLVAGQPAEVETKITFSKF